MQCFLIIFTFTTHSYPTVSILQNFTYSCSQFLQTYWERLVLPRYITHWVMFSLRVSFLKENDSSSPGRHQVFPQAGLWFMKSSPPLARTLTCLIWFRSSASHWAAVCSAVWSCHVLSCLFWYLLSLWFQRQTFHIEAALLSCFPNMLLSS